MKEPLRSRCAGRLGGGEEMGREREVWEGMENDGVGENRGGEKGRQGA